MSLESKLNIEISILDALECIQNILSALEPLKRMISTESQMEAPPPGRHLKFFKNLPTDCILLHAVSALCPGA